MVKDYLDSERKHAATTWATLSFSSKGSIICTIHRQGSTYHDQASKIRHSDGPEQPIFSLGQAKISKGLSTRQP